MKKPILNQQERWFANHGRTLYGQLLLLHIEKLRFKREVQKMIDSIRVINSVIKALNN